MDPKSLKYTLTKLAAGPADETGELGDFTPVATDADLSWTEAVDALVERYGVSREEAPGMLRYALALGKNKSDLCVTMGERRDLLMVISCC